LRESWFPRAGTRRPRPDQNFNTTLERDLDQAIAPIELAPQDMARRWLSLLGDAFYAIGKRSGRAGDPDFIFVVKVRTREVGDAVEMRIHDNGIGIPPDIKVFQPFFTTKPMGNGTGWARRPRDQQSRSTRRRRSAWSDNSPI
jgi:two-component system, NtrC family, sensor kinase